MTPRLPLVPKMLNGFAIAGLLLVGACALGDVEGPDTTDPDGDDPVRIPADDPEVDERLDALDIICESTLVVTGTFVEGAAPPADHNGCWPVGTWTINTEVDRLGCDPQPSLSADYVYNVVFDEEDNAIYVAFNNEPDDERVNLKISTAGDSLCHGAMEHFGTDNAVWSLLPVLQLDGTLQGVGAYSVYNEDPF